MPDPDLYGLIHRALRLELARLSDRIAATRWTERPAVITACAATDRVLDFLDDHATVEDVYLGPLIRAADPAAAHEVEADHAALHILRQTLREQTRALRAGVGAGVAPRAVAMLEAVIEAEFRHMRREELDV